jgi:hypothetical protein
VAFCFYWCQVRRFFAAEEIKINSSDVSYWPIFVQVVGFSPRDKGWSYRVKVAIRNSLDRVLKLDEVSVAYGGKAGAPGMVSNNLFKVSMEGKEIQYRGEMKKRAPPKHFIELKPGEVYEVVVELGDAYPIPAGAHDMSVEFEHTNHFSPDGFSMKSPPEHFRMENAWAL